MVELRGQAAREVFDILLRDRLLRLAFERDMFALSGSGAFERVVERTDRESPPTSGTVELVVGDATTTVTVTDEPDTTLPPVPARGDSTLSRLGRHVRNDYFDDSAGGISLDRLAGCRIEYSYADGRDHLLIHDADAEVAVPHVQTPD